MTLRVGVIGTGYWGKNLMRNFDALGVLAAFFDSNEDTVRRFSEQYPQAKAFRDLEALLADPDVEAVAIATPAVTHGMLADKCLRAGKHVFVEKPLCLDPEEALRLKNLADAEGLTLMVGHLLLYHPAFHALRNAVAEGVIGKLRYIYSTRASLGKIRKEENALWSFAPHDISMILALVGRMPKRVTCNGEAWLSNQVADLTLSHLDFGDGQQAHIFVSWLHPYKDHRLVAIGENGMIVFNDTVTGEEKLLHYPHSVDWQGDMPVPNKAEARPIPYEATEPLRAECTHFLDSVANGSVPRSDAEEGIRVLSVLDMCQTALTSGSPVDRA